MQGVKSKSIMTDKERDTGDIMSDPNFMIIGAQKSGTSWLAKMIRQHPDVYAPEKKELHFFNLQENYSKGIDWYRTQFAGRNGEIAVGESTPNYLWQCNNQQEIDELGVIPDIAEQVHRHYPDLKLIVSMRDPVDRAVSAYYHFIRSRKYSPRSRILDVGHTNGILTMGYYYRYINEWLKYYPIDHFLFLVYEEDIKKNKLETLKKTFRFLNVDENFIPENVNSRYNTRSGHLFLHMNYYSPLWTRRFFRLFPALRPVNFPKIEVGPDEMEKLSQMYAKENEGLAALIKRPLPW